MPLDLPAISESPAGTPRGNDSANGTPTASPRPASLLKSLRQEREKRVSSSPLATDPVTDADTTPLRQRRSLASVAGFATLGAARERQPSMLSVFNKPAVTLDKAAAETKAHVDRLAAELAAVKGEKTDLASQLSRSRAEADDTKAENARILADLHVARSELEVSSGPKERGGGGDPQSSAGEGNTNRSGGGGAGASSSGNEEDDVAANPLRDGTRREGGEAIRQRLQDERDDALASLNKAEERVAHQRKMIEKSDSDLRNTKALLQQVEADAGELKAAASAADARAGSARRDAEAAAAAAAAALSRLSGVEDRAAEDAAASVQECERLVAQLASSRKDLTSVEERERDLGSLVANLREAQEASSSTGAARRSTIQKKEEELIASQEETLRLRKELAVSGTHWREAAAASEQAAAAALTRAKRDAELALAASQAAFADRLAAETGALKEATEQELAALRSTTEAEANAAAAAALKSEAQAEESVRESLERQHEAAISALREGMQDSVAAAVAQAVSSSSASGGGAVGAGGVGGGVGAAESDQSPSLLELQDQVRQQEEMLKRAQLDKEELAAQLDTMHAINKKLSGGGKRKSGGGGGGGRPQRLTRGIGESGSSDSSSSDSSDDDGSGLDSAILMSGGGGGGGGGGGVAGSEMSGRDSLQVPPPPPPPQQQQQQQQAQPAEHSDDGSLTMTMSPASEQKRQQAVSKHRRGAALPQSADGGSQDGNAAQAAAGAAAYLKASKEYSADEHEAAVRLQARVRGMQARSDVEAYKQLWNEELEEEAAQQIQAAWRNFKYGNADTARGSQADREGQPDSADNSPRIADSAAVALQAAARGFIVRSSPGLRSAKEVAALRKENGRLRAAVQASGEIVESKEDQCRAAEEQVSQLSSAVEALRGDNALLAQASSSAVAVAEERLKLRKYRSLLATLITAATSAGVASSFAALQRNVTACSAASAVAEAASATAALAQAQLAAREAEKAETAMKRHAQEAMKHAQGLSNKRLFAQRLFDGARSGLFRARLGPAWADWLCFALSRKAEAVSATATSDAEILIAKRLSEESEMHSKTLSEAKRHTQHTERVGARLAATAAGVLAAGLAALRLNEVSSRAAAERSDALKVLEGKLEAQATAERKAADALAAARSGSAVVAAERQAEEASAKASAAQASQSLEREALLLEEKRSLLEEKEAAKQKAAEAEELLLKAAREKEEAAAAAGALAATQSTLAHATTLRRGVAAFATAAACRGFKALHVLERVSASRADCKLEAEGSLAACRRASDEAAESERREHERRAAALRKEESVSFEGKLEAVDRKNTEAAMKLASARAIFSAAASSYRMSLGACLNMMARASNAAAAAKKKEEEKEKEKEEEGVTSRTPQQRAHTSLELIALCAYRCVDRGLYVGLNAWRNFVTRKAVSTAKLAAKRKDTAHKELLKKGKLDAFVRFIESGPAQCVASAFAELKARSGCAAAAAAAEAGLVEANRKCVARLSVQAFLTRNASDLTRNAFAVLHSSCVLHGRMQAQHHTHARKASTQQVVRVAFHCLHGAQLRVLRGWAAEDAKDVLAVGHKRSFAGSTLVLAASRFATAAHGSALAKLASHARGVAAADGARRLSSCGSIFAMAGLTSSLLQRLCIDHMLSLRGQGVGQACATAFVHARGNVVGVLRDTVRHWRVAALQAKLYEALSCARKGMLPTLGHAHAHTVFLYTSKITGGALALALGQLKLDKLAADKDEEIEVLESKNAMLQLRSAEALGKATKSKGLLEEKDRQMATQRDEIDFLMTQRDNMKTQRDTSMMTARGTPPRSGAVGKNQPIAAKVPDTFNLPNKAEMHRRFSQEKI